MTRDVNFRGWFHGLVELAVNAVTRVMHEQVLLSRFQIRSHHLGDELAKCRFGFPSKLPTRLAGIPHQGVHFGGPKVVRIDCNDASPIAIERLFFGTNSSPGQFHP